MDTRFLASAFLPALAFSLAFSCAAQPSAGSDGPSGAAGDSSDVTANAPSGPGQSSGGDAGRTTPGGGGDISKAIFDSVDKSSLAKLLNDITGANPVTVGGQSLLLKERWSPTAKADFRKYWSQYFTALGATVKELPFAIPNLVGETQGTNLEAVLPGRSADTVVIIVHYDSVGIKGHEKENPAADDDGSGLVMQMEAARIFAQHKDRANTVRFVAADYEEISENLAGDFAYVDYLQLEAAAKGFKILVAADNDQSGWSCWSEGLCNKGAPAVNTTFRMVSCDDKTGMSFPALLTGINDIATKYSSITVHGECDGDGDTDHYPFWLKGIPAFVVQEYSVGNNPHYDETGNDTMAHLDVDYLFHIAQVAITYQAKLAGVGE